MKYLFLFLFSIGSITLKGYTVSKLWLWFVATQYGLPLISIPVAIGISYMALLMTFQVPDVKKEYDNVNTMCMHYAMSLVCLLFGYIVKQFI